MKDVWLRGEEPKKDNLHWIWWVLIGIVVFLIFYTFPVRAAMTCDGDNDGKVSISELVQGVNNALDPCYEGCFDTCFEDEGNCPCPGNCSDFTIVDNVRCAVSICQFSNAQVRACFQRFRAAHPNYCSEVGR